MVKKSRLPPPPGPIRKTDVRGERLAFSFRFFTDDEALCPRNRPDDYTQTLMERLRDLSNWTVADFVEKRSKTVRNHPITWSETSRAAGFAHLPEQVRDEPAWQFSLSANEHGRVHGLLIGSLFHVVWLDCNHQLYPQR